MFIIKKLEMEKTVIFMGYLSQYQCPQSVVVFFCVLVKCVVVCFCGGSKSPKNHLGGANQLPPLPLLGAKNMRPPPMNHRFKGICELYKYLKEGNCGHKV